MQKQKFFPSKRVLFNWDCTPNVRSRRILSRIFNTVINYDVATVPSDEYQSKGYPENSINGLDFLDFGFRLTPRRFEYLNDLYAVQMTQQFTSWNKSQKKYNFSRIQKTITILRILSSFLFFYCYLKMLTHFRRSQEQFYFLMSIWCVKCFNGFRT